MPNETTKRKAKDSVFVDLFQDKNNVFQLYQGLHPEDKELTIEEISIQTLEAIFVNKLYNDLGFIAGEKLIMLVEAQSVWNPNMPLRMLFYLAETYRCYLSDTQQNEHNRTKLKLPKPELYVLYSGNRKAPEFVSFKDTFFDESCSVDLQVKIITEVNETIYGQYIGFCKVFDEQREKYQDKLECIQKTIEICKQKGYLVDYLTLHEKEAVTMMAELFDQEYQQKQYHIAMEKELREELREEVKGEIREELKEELSEEFRGEEKIRTAKSCLAMGTISESDIAKITGLSLQKIQELAEQMKTQSA